MSESLSEMFMLLRYLRHTKSPFLKNLIRALQLNLPLVRKSKSKGTSKLFPKVIFITFPWIVGDITVPSSFFVSTRTFKQLFFSFFFA